MNDVSIYLIISLSTIIIYHFTAKIFEKSKLKEIKKRLENEMEKSIIIRKCDPISINEYSFFILSLLLPFITEDPSDLLNLLIMSTLIFILIIIMIKKNQIIINPIFLFSRFKTYKITGEFEGERIEYYVITKVENFSNRDGKDFSFVYFDEDINEVIFISDMSSEK